MTITEAAKQFLATAETWRQDELDIKRRTLADLEQQLATAQEKARTLPVQIGNLRATIAHREAQTAADIAREAMQAVRGSEQEQPAMSCPSCKREYPDFDGAGVVFCNPKQGGCGFCRHVELKGQPMGDKTVMVCTACWEVQEKEQPKPEPFRAGLPPERLRRVWAEWEDETGIVQLRKNGDGWEYRYAHWPNEQEWGDVYSDIWGSANIRPHGATWARVEAMADAAEKPKCPACGKQPDCDALPLSPGEHVTCQSCQLYLRVVDGAWQIVRPVENCGHVADDGTCGHPNAQTPECHDGVVCPVKAADASGYLGFRVGARPIAIPPEHRDEVPMCDAGCKVFSDGWRHYRTCKYVAWMQGKDLPVEQEQAPTLLDLTKLQPGTVCEALGEIRTYSGVLIKPGEIFKIDEPDDGTNSSHPTGIETHGSVFSVPAFVPAVVVEPQKGAQS